MAKILIVEDDKEINKLLEKFLSDLGYDILTASNGLDAVRIIRDDDTLSLVILDLMLPYQSGDSVIAKVRSFSSVPIIVLSAKSTVQSKIDVLRLGADDYITKPFDLDELSVRIEVQLRRTMTDSQSPTNIIKYKDIELDTSSKTVKIRGNNVIFTSKEYLILELLFSNPQKLFSKANLFESVWGEPYFNDDNSIKVHMSNLRNKLKKYAPDEEYIETIWGMGYKLKS